MKKPIYFFVTLSLFALFLSSYNFLDRNTIRVPNQSFTIPENIDAIFTKSCYGCHSVESTTYKAKMKLKLDQLGTMKLSKLVSKLNKIAKEVEKGDMPTKKFAANYPDKMPTDEENKILIDWARNSAKQLAGE